VAILSIHCWEPESFDGICPVNEHHTFNYERAPGTPMCSQLNFSHTYNWVDRAETWFKLNQSDYLAQDFGLGLSLVILYGCWGFLLINLGAYNLSCELGSRGSLSAETRGTQTHQQKQEPAMENFWEFLAWCMAIQTLNTRLAQFSLWNSVCWLSQNICSNSWLDGH
jgi:hypothetical protein